MPFFSISFPMIDPVLLFVGPFPIRWYALAYVAGLIAGWGTTRFLVGRDRLWRAGQLRPSVVSIDDLVVYIAIGIIVGGRAGYVLFYNFDFFLANPAEIPKLWTGGMAFHGGLIGAVLGLAIFARRQGVPVLTVADAVAAGVPFGLLFGRLANFIKPELWGRVSDVPWAMIFPGGGTQPRHPSQLYEAALEGVLLLTILALAIRRGALHRPGIVCGLFALGYGLARITAEFFREPDAQLGFLFGGATMGMLLSLPLMLLGAFLLFYAARRRDASTP